MSFFVSPEEAVIVAERIRKRIEEAAFRAYDESLKITISAGVSIYPSDARSAETLIEHADKALYDAKRAGKNVVKIYRK